MQLFFKLIKDGESFEIPSGMSLLGTAAGAEGCGIVYADTAPITPETSITMVQDGTELTPDTSSGSQATPPAPTTSDAPTSN